MEHEYIVTGLGAPNRMDLWENEYIVEANALLLQFGFHCIYYPDSTEYPFC
jgi:hypothetical protein